MRLNSHVPTSSPSSFAEFLFVLATISDSYDARLFATERRIYALESKVAEEEQRIAEQDMWIAEHDRRIAEQDKRIAEHDIVLKNLQESMEIFNARS
jgi:uncharacterized coiled-coil protein SlyX